MSNGKYYDITHKVDSISSKGESIVVVDGTAVLDDAKVRSFDRWAKEYMPSPEVFYSSTFAAQGYGGFLDMETRDRKAVLLRTLGVERLERLAEAARFKAKELKKEQGLVEARLEGAAHVPLPDKLEHEYQLVSAEIVRLHNLANDWMGEVNALKLLELWEVERDQLVQKRNMLQQESQRILNKISDLDSAVIVADKIRKADEVTRNAKKELKSLLERESEVNKKRRVADEKMNSIRSELEMVGRSNESLRFDIKETQYQLKKAPAIESAVNKLESLNVNVEENFKTLSDLVKRLDVMRMSFDANMSDRIVDLRDGLKGVIDSESLDQAVGVADDCLVDDQEAEANAILLPDRIEVLEEAVDVARDVYQKSIQHASECGQLAGRMDVITSARARLVELDTRMDASKCYEEGLFDLRDLWLDKCQSLDNESNILRDQIRENEAVVAKYAPMVKRMLDLRTAEAMTEELRSNQCAIENDIERITKDLQSLGEEPKADPQARAELKKVEMELIENKTRADLLKKSLQEAKEVDSWRTNLRSTLKELKEDFSNYTRLAQDLGRNGIQALEVDAAGTELTELANDLLHTCFGPRWTVSIETQRSSADGKKTIEGCDVRVIDTLRGRDASAESLSGGERVLVSEAISLALSMLATRRAGVKGATIVRDETGAALDPDAAVSYVAMLRRAAELVEASHVLFVTHNQEARDLADAIVWVKDGKIEVS
jgi:exonuclease SbcC